VAIVAFGGGPTQARGGGTTAGRRLVVLGRLRDDRSLALAAFIVAVVAALTAVGAVVAIALRATNERRYAAWQIGAAEDLAAPDDALDEAYDPAGLIRFPLSGTHNAHTPILGHAHFGSVSTGGTRAADDRSASLPLAQEPPD
jgi:hypothetical protein